MLLQKQKQKGVNMEVSQIVSLAALGIFSVFLALGFLVGLARGAKKASLRLGVFVVTTIFAFFITPVVSKFALNYDLSTLGLDGSLGDYIQSMIAQQPEVADFVASSTTMQNFVNQLPYLVLNLVMFIVVFLAMNFVGFIAYQVLRSIFLRKKKTKEWKDGNAYKVALENKKPSKHRFLGGLVGGLQNVAFVSIMLLPLTGFVSLANDIIYQPENTAHAAVVYSPTSTLLQENIPAEVLDGIKAFKASPLAIASSIIGVDTFMFDTLTKVEVETQDEVLKISYRSELLAFADIYNNLEYLTKVDYNNIVYKDLDYNKIENAVDIIFDSKLLNVLAPEVINWVISDINKPISNQVLGLQLPSDQLNIINKITAEYQAEFGSIYKGLRNDLNTVVQVAVGAGKSGLIDEATSQNINLDEIKDILSANNKEVITNTFSNLFKAVSLRVVAVEAINMGIDNLSSTITFSPVSYEKVDWDGVVSDITSIANNILDMLVNVSEEFSGGIQEVLEENPYELLYADTTLLTTKLGTIMTTLQHTNLLVDENGNKVIYNQLMDYLNTTEFANYVNFTPFKQPNAWMHEMANLNNLILAVKKSTILSDVVNNIETPENIDFVSVLSKIKNIDPDNSKTYTYNIINSVLSSNAFAKLIDVAFDMLNEIIADNQQILGTGVDLGKIQGHRLNNEQEKAYILSFFDNIVLYAAEIEWDGSQSQLVSAIVSSNLSKLGLALDAIENSALFGAYTENGIDHDGVYVSLIYALKNNNQISDYVDFEIVLDPSFDGWNTEFARVESILANLETIQINGKTLINAIIDGDDLTSLIDNIDVNDIDLLVDPIINSQLLSKNVAMFVNTINQMVEDFTGYAIGDASKDDIVEQKEDVKTILKKALDLTGVLTGSFDQTALEANGEVFGSFLNLLKGNKLNYSNGVFAETYDALFAYLANDLPFSGTISDLLDEYVDLNDIDWEDLFELFAEMENQEIETGFTAQFKTLFGKVFASMKQDSHFEQITPTVLTFLESFANLEGITTLEDFVAAYTNALATLATEQDAFALGDVEYSNRVGTVLDFFNNFIPASGFDILDLKKITNYGAEIDSANLFETSLESFDTIDFMTDDENDINAIIDDLLHSLASSQLMFEFIEQSTMVVEVSDPIAQTMISNRIEANYTGTMEARLKAFFGIA